jgi:hypothetical protein
MLGTSVGIEDVDAEAAAVGGDVREIDVVAAAEHVLMSPAHDFLHVALELRLAQVAEFDRHEIAMHAQHRR